MRGVVIFHKGMRIAKRLPEAHVVEFISLATARFSGAEIHTHSLLEATMPPPSFQRKGRYLWCPYCDKPQQFWLDPVMELVRCPVCYISDRDFYLRKANKLDDLKGHIIDAIRKGRGDRKAKEEKPPKEKKAKPIYTKKLKKVRRTS